MPREHRREPTIHEEEAPHVGEPADATVQELAGVAPPCDECGRHPAVDGDLCDDCADGN